jgi:hypothetical protein
MEDPGRIYPGANGQLPGGIAEGVYEAAIRHEGDPPGRPPLLLRNVGRDWFHEGGGRLFARDRILWVRPSRD